MATRKLGDTKMAVYWICITMASVHSLWLFPLVIVHRSFWRECSQLSSLFKSVEASEHSPKMATSWLYWQVLSCQCFVHGSFSSAEMQFRKKIKVFKLSTFVFFNIFWDQTVMPSKLLVYFEDNNITGCLQLLPSLRP